MNVYFHTFGCKANQYDTELVRQAFADQGAVVVDDPAGADVAVVNSCTVTHESEVKMRGFVRRLALGDGGLCPTDGNGTQEAQNVGSQQTSMCFLSPFCASCGLFPLSSGKAEFIR